MSDFKSFDPIAGPLPPSVHPLDVELPDAGTIAATMIHIGQLADGIRYDIKLVVCPANAHLYVRIKVEEEMFFEDNGFTMVDYVPISPGELVDLKTRASLEMLDRIQELSIGRTCIATTRGTAQWMDRVFYPHT